MNRVPVPGAAWRSRPARGGRTTASSCPTSGIHPEDAFCFESGGNRVYSSRSLDLRVSPEGSRSEVADGQAGRSPARGQSSVCGSRMDPGGLRAPAVPSGPGPLAPAPVDRRGASRPLDRRPRIRTPKARPGGSPMTMGVLLLIAAALTLAAVYGGRRIRLSPRALESFRQIPFQVGALAGDRPAPPVRAGIRRAARRRGRVHPERGPVPGAGAGGCANRGGPSLGGRGRSGGAAVCAASLPGGRPAAGDVLSSPGSHRMGWRQPNGLHRRPDPLPGPPTGRRQHPGRVLSGEAILAGEAGQREGAVSLFAMPDPSGAAAMWPLDPSLAVGEEALTAAPREDAPGRWLAHDLLRWLLIVLLIAAALGAMGRG
jgi:hypothetical protein